MMLPEITAQQITERIQKNLGVPWKNPVRICFIQEGQVHGQAIPPQN
jgi:hypothetical protein